MRPDPASEAERAVAFLPREKSMVVNYSSDERGRLNDYADLSMTPGLRTCFRSELEVYDVFRLSYSRRLATAKFAGEWLSCPPFRPMESLRQPFYFSYGYAVAVSNSGYFYGVPWCHATQGYRDMYRCAEGRDACPTAVLLVNALNNEQVSMHDIQVLRDKESRQAAKILNVAANAAADQANLKAIADVADQAWLVHNGLPAFVEVLQRQLHSC